MDRLEFLLQRYKNNTATPEEVEELSGLMDGVFKDSSDSGELSETGEEDLKMVFGKLDAVPLKRTGKVRYISNLKSRETVSSADSDAEARKIAPIRRFRSWYVRAAAVLVIVMGVGLIVLNSGKWFGSSLPDQQRNTMSAIFRGKQVVDLPDGTKVVLNSDSELSYDAASFGENNREVNLTGEAVFDVTHNPLKPFLVRTGKITTKVLGTEFNVNAYPEREQVTVTVLRGLVEVGDEQRTFGKIRPNEQINVDVKSNAFVKQNAQAEEVLAWQKNFFILDHVTFREAAAKIEERFKVKVIINNESAKDCVVTAWFVNNETLEEVIEGLGIVQQATPIVRGDTVIFEGGADCKSAN